MNSQDTILQTLLNLSEWSEEEVQENLDRVLPILQSVLNQKEQKSLSLQAIQRLLGTCLPCVTVDKAEKDVLHYTLPATKTLFVETISDIEDQLLNVASEHSDVIIDTLTSLLNVSIELLNCVDFSLHYVISLGRVQFSTVPSIPKTVMFVLHESFKHCNNSKIIYGNLFEDLSNVLSALFHKSHEVQHHFLGVISDNIHFRCEYEDDLSTLTDVIETFGQIGELVCGLDVKTMAMLWKGYTQLVELNSEHLKNRLNVENPIKFLAKDVTSSLKTITDGGENEIKIVNQTLKIGSFTLKILMKICEVFAGYLGNCHRELVALLVDLNLHCRSYMETKSVPCDISEGVQQHLVVGADPLLNLLLGQLEFVDSYFEYQVNSSSDVEDGEDDDDIDDDTFIGFILLTNTIFKKLLKANPSVRQLWQNRDRNILSQIFSALNDSHREMCLDLNITVSGERSVQLYEATLMSVSAFVLSTPASEFPAVEQVLLESVLQPNVWRALLASDVWCVLARYESSELCCEHVCYLTSILQSIPNHISCPERIYLEALLGRLFPLLSDKSKSEVAKLYPPTEYNALWEIFHVKQLPEKLKYSYVEKILVLANFRIEVFLHSAPSVAIYDSLLESLMAISSVLDSSCEIQQELVSNIASHVVTLWQCATLPELLSPAEVCEQGSQWLHRLVVLLCKVTCLLIKYMSNAQLLQVLQRLNSISRKSSSLIGIAATTVLEALGTKIIEPDCDELSVCSQIAALFCTLLQSKHVLVHQVALEAFAYFAYVTQHEAVVALSVSENKTLQQQVSSYLQKVKPEQRHGNESLKTYKEYLKCQTQLRFAHKCCVKKLCGVNSKAKVKSLSDENNLVTESFSHGGHNFTTTDTENKILERIKRIDEDVAFIATFSKDNTLSQNAKQAIRDVELQLHQLISP